MASEHKRQTTATKVPIVLPKSDNVSSAPSALVSQDMSLQLAIGSRIRLTTVSPSPATFEGTVYTADPITNLLVLHTGSASQAAPINSTSFTAPPGQYRILPVSQISNFQILSLPTASTANPTTSFESQPAPVLDHAALQGRLVRNIAAQHAAQLRLGPKGTTPTDQALFDALSRTHPARWHGGAMIISDMYVIEKPYHANNVRFVEGGHGDLERMKKVVDMERNKVTLRMGKGLIDGRMGGGDKDGKNLQGRKGG